eukprot:GFKZ01014930.1.p1 GENE.GFKZ01014930.1~~GFKZ01014930.1.p1  ORF type:complete len:803 (+),score=72.74 GFKZ01014930.1:186-2594(+)
MSRLHHPNPSLPPCPNSQTPHYTWQQIWSFFMRAPRVRAWLFQRDPPPRSHVVQTLLSSPMLVGYIFGSQQSSLYAFPDIGDLVTVFTRDAETLLGFHFGFKGLNPIMPLLFQVMKDPALGNPNVLVRRTARQRAPPPYSDFFLAIEFNWFQSGVLSVVTSISRSHPTTAPAAHPHPYLNRAEHRVFNKKTALRLSRTAETLSNNALGPHRFSNTSHSAYRPSHPMHPTDLPIDFIDPPDDYYVLIAREPEDTAPTATLTAYHKRQDFNVEPDFAKHAADSTTTTATTSNTTAATSDDRSNSPHPQTSPPSSNASPQHMLLDGYQMARQSEAQGTSQVQSVGETGTMKLWHDFQEKVTQSKRTGVIITMLAKKIGGRFAREVPVFGRESRYIFLSTSGISVRGRIQRLCTKLNIDLGSPLLERSLLCEREGDDRQESTSLGERGGLAAPTQLLAQRNWQAAELVVGLKRDKRENVSLALMEEGMSARRRLGYEPDSVMGTLGTIQGKRIQTDLSDGGIRRKRRRCAEVSDLLHVSDEAEGSTVDPERLPFQISQSGRRSVKTTTTSAKVGYSTSGGEYPGSQESKRRSFHLTNILSAGEPTGNGPTASSRSIISSQNRDATSALGAPKKPRVVAEPSATGTRKPEPIEKGSMPLEEDPDASLKDSKETDKEKNGNKMIWTCDRCGIRIRGKKGNLNRHIANKHDNIRAFACSKPNCGRKFQTRLNLVRHEKAVHLGRPFQCVHCPRSFKVEEDRSAHMRAAHETANVTLACKICGSCFGRRSTLNRHMAKVHRPKAEEGVAS